MPHHKSEVSQSSRRASVFDRLGAKSGNRLSVNSSRRPRSAKHVSHRFARSGVEDQTGQSFRSAPRQDDSDVLTTKRRSTRRAPDQYCASSSDQEDVSSSSCSSASRSGSSNSSLSSCSGSDRSRQEEADSGRRPLRSRRNHHHHQHHQHHQQDQHHHQKQWQRPQKRRRSEVRTAGDSAGARVPSSASALASRRPAGEPALALRRSRQALDNEQRDVAHAAYRSHLARDGRRSRSRDTGPSPVVSGAPVKYCRSESPAERRPSDTHSLRSCPSTLGSCVSASSAAIAARHAGSRHSGTGAAHQRLSQRCLTPDTVASCDQRRLGRRRCGRSFSCERRTMDTIRPAPLLLNDALLSPAGGGAAAAESGSGGDVRRRRHLGPRNLTPPHCSSSDRTRASGGGGGRRRNRDSVESRDPGRVRSCRPAVANHSSDSVRDDQGSCAASDQPPTSAISSSSSSSRATGHRTLLSSLSHSHSAARSPDSGRRDSPATRASSVISAASASDSDETDHPDPSDLIVRDEVRCDDAGSDTDDSVTSEGQMTESEQSDSHCSPSQQQQQRTGDSLMADRVVTDSLLESSPVSCVDTETCDDVAADVDSVTPAAPPDPVNAAAVSLTTPPYPVNAAAVSLTTPPDPVNAAAVSLTTPPDPVNAAAVSLTTPPPAPPLLAESLSDFSDDADDILNREDEMVSAGDGSVPHQLDTQQQQLPALGGSSWCGDVTKLSDTQPAADRQPDDWEMVDWTSLAIESTGTRPASPSLLSVTSCHQQQQLQLQQRAAGGALWRLSPTALLSSLGVCRQWLRPQTLARVQQQLRPGDKNWPSDVSIGHCARDGTTTAALSAMPSAAALTALSIVRRVAGRS